MVSVTVKIYLIALHSSISGLLCGLDIGFIGTVTQMEQFTHSIGSISSATLGIYVAFFLLSASVSSLCSGYVADILSRKYAILSGALIIALGATFSACATNYSMLLGARLLTGVGQGQTVSVTTIYLCELSPHRIRGAVANMLTLLITIGIAAGFFISYSSSRLSGSLAWRAPFIVEAAFGVILAVGMIFVPYSPRWLVERGRLDEAKAVLWKYRDVSDVEKELLDIETSLQEEGTDQGSFADLFTRRYIRRTVLGIFFMAIQMLAGIDALFYYAPILFTQAGFSAQRASFLASAISGVIPLLCTIPAQHMVDHWGRRYTYIGGGFAMALCHLVIGILYAVYSRKSDGEVYVSGQAPKWIIIVLMYLVICNYAWSWAIVSQVYACEIMPTRVRAKACSLQQLANGMINFIVQITMPSFLRYAISGPYFLFCGATFFGSFIGYFFMPETKGMSLEEIELVFERRSIESLDQCETL